MNTSDVVRHFQPQYPFFSRELLYYFIKQGYVHFKAVRLPGRILPTREFDEEEVKKIEGLLEMYQKRREAEREAEEIVNTPRPEPARPRVLIVEDEADHLLLLEAELEGEYEVTVAATAEQGQEAVEKQRFDAVIVDLQMPKVRGAWKEKDTGLPVVDLARSKGIGVILVISATLRLDLESQLSSQGLVVFRKPKLARDVAEELRKRLHSREADGGE